VVPLPRFRGGGCAVNRIEHQKKSEIREACPGFRFTQSGLRLLNHWTQEQQKVVFGLRLSSFNCATDTMDDASQPADEGSSRKLSLWHKVTAGILGLAALLGALGVIFGDFSTGLTKTEETYVWLRHRLFPQIVSEGCHYTSGPLVGKLTPAVVPERGPNGPVFPPENSPCSDPKTGSTGVYKARYAE
jgi:hypothetical protein